MAEIRGIGYILVGYLAGSILFAKLFGMLFRGKDIVQESPDRNPGTANAFQYGGFWCGLLTLLGDLSKGFFPVFLYMRRPDRCAGVVMTALVIAAPVIGHVFSAFWGFHGGKGIATSFGSLLGLYPALPPLIILAIFFLFFSLILRITPHWHRTILTYLCAVVLMRIVYVDRAAFLGFCIITAVVLVRLLRSPEEKEKMKVRLLWMH